MYVVFLGPPGVGKGTQAALLSSKKNIPHIATGDLLRDAIKDKTKLGLEVGSVISSGKLVPDALVLKLVEDKLSSLHLDSGYILDGFPRTLRQAEGLTKILEKNASKLEHVIYFSLNDELIVNRITGRRSCPSCNAVYHLIYNKPDIEGVCKCGASLVLRKDDTPATLRNRLAVYHRETFPLIEYYSEKSLLCRINAGGALVEVANRVEQILLPYPPRHNFLGRSV